VNVTINGKVMYESDINVGSEQLVVNYASLVKRIAYHMIGRLPPSVQIDDLIQSGMIGLLEASKNFDDNKGASFETYAGIRIRGSMIDEIRRGDWAPRSVHKNARMIAQAIKKIENATGRDARDHEVAAFLEISLNDYHKMLQDSAGTKIFGFEDLNGAEDFIVESSTAATFLSPFEGVQNSNFKKELANCISKLPERERMVLALYYNEELNLREIGEVLEVSESRVSQIHSQAMLRLQVRMKDWRQDE